MIQIRPPCTAEAPSELTAPPFADGEFCAATLCVSIPYLTSPVGVPCALARVLNPGSPLTVTNSNRYFAAKAVDVFVPFNDAGHGELIEHYLTEATSSTAIERRERSSAPGKSDPLYVVVANSLDPTPPDVDKRSTASAQERPRPQTRPFLLLLHGCHNGDRLFAVAMRLALVTERKIEDSQRGQADANYIAVIEQPVQPAFAAGVMVDRVSLGQRSTGRHQECHDSSMDDSGHDLNSTSQQIPRINCLFGHCITGLLTDVLRPLRPARKTLSQLNCEGNYFGSRVVHPARQSSLGRFRGHFVRRVLSEGQGAEIDLAANVVERRTEIATGGICHRPAWSAA